MSIILCPKCNSLFENVSKWGDVKKFCSRHCANSRVWTEQDKLKKSESAKKSEKILKANRDISKKEILKKNMIKLISLGKVHFLTDEDRLKGKETYRKRCLEKRKKLDSLDIKKVYRKQCQFNFNLSDYPKEFDFSLIEKFGWYKPSNKGNNLEGVSRDHKLSISDGWKLKIEPWKIRHPANCRLLKHTDNKLKAEKSILNEKELDLIIESWNKKYGVFV